MHFDAVLDEAIDDLAELVLLLIGSLLCRNESKIFNLFIRWVLVLLLVPEGQLRVRERAILTVQGVLLVVYREDRDVAVLSDLLQALGCGFGRLINLSNCVSRLIRV